MKASVRPTDLTAGRPLPVLALYAIPMLASMFFQQAYNLADSWIAGNQMGSAALGAVGTCYPITVFFIAIASGLSMGTSIFCSQHFGAREYGQVRAGIRTALVCFLPFSLALTLLSIPATPLILKWLAVPPEALTETGRYLTIYLAGIPFLFLYNISTGVLSGLGDSRTPLFFLIFSSLCNIVLDLLLVILIPLGVAGLALATLLSQAAAGIATLFAVRRMERQLVESQEEAATTLLSRPAQGAPAPSLAGPAQKEPAPLLADPARGERLPFVSRPALAEILRLGIPSVIQHVFMSTGQLVLQGVINRYGLTVMAGYSVAFRINGLVVNSLMAVSNALSGYIAQNQGAGKPDRIRAGFRICLAVSYLFSGAVVLLLLTAGPAILSLFVGADLQREAIIRAGMGFVRIVAPFYLLVCLKIVCDGALRGIGAMTLFTLSTVSDVLIRIFFGNLFSGLWGIRGVWWIWPLAWLVGTAVSLGGYIVKNKGR